MMAIWPWMFRWFIVGQNFGGSRSIKGCCVYRNFSDQWKLYELPGCVFGDPEARIGISEGRNARGMLRHLQTRPQVPTIGRTLYPAKKTYMHIYI